MSRTRIVKGKITEITGGTLKYFANSIKISAGGSINYYAKNYTYGEPLEPPVSKYAEFDIDFELDNEEKTIVPFGIKDFEDNPENQFLKFKLKVRGAGINQWQLDITNEDGIIYTCYSSTQELNEVVITDKKTEVIPDTKKSPEVSLPGMIPAGEYSIIWDGFDNKGIYDSTLFNGKKIKAQITATKGDKKKTKEIDFELSYDKVDWVDAKVDRNTKRIDVTLRVNLTDGGENGLTCQNINASDIYGMPARTVCDWDKIPASAIHPSNPIIKSRTRSFKDLEKLAIDGLNYHWGRNRNHAEGKNININGILYEIYVLPENTNKNTMDDISLNYNTNDDWMRSGNPGTATWNPISWIGNTVSREAICYNIGYIKYSNGWGYSHAAEEDLEFKDTSAHEIGHEILKSYGSTNYSYGHKGSSEVYSFDQHMKDDAPEFPLNGEIDLMPYFNDNILGGKWKQPNYFQRRIAAEKDVLSLVWLTKLKIK